jgi:hypothetical protein
VLSKLTEKAVPSGPEVLGLLKQALLLYASQPNLFGDSNENGYLKKKKRKEKDFKLIQNWKRRKYMSQKFKSPLTINKDIASKSSLKGLTA